MFYVWTPGLTSQVVRSYPEDRFFRDLYMVGWPALDTVRQMCYNVLQGDRIASIITFILTIMALNYVINDELPGILRAVIEQSLEGKHGMKVPGV